MPYPGIKTVPAVPAAAGAPPPHHPVADDFYNHLVVLHPMVISKKICSFYHYYQYHYRYHYDYDGLNDWLNVVTGWIWRIRFVWVSWKSTSQ